jgi:hypothetical protein
MRALILSLVMAASALADTGPISGEAQAILQRVRANRLAKDFALKARLFVTRDQPVPLEIFVRNSAQETRTLYRAGTNEVLAIQPVEGASRIFVKGAGEVDNRQSPARWLGSAFSYADLAVPFLHWGEARLLGEERTRGRDCHVIETRGTGGHDAHAKLWIDREYDALLRAEVYDENDALLKRFAVTSFKRIDRVWIPRGMELSQIPRGQALPAREKSRLEIYDGDYDARLAGELFDPARFARDRP